MYRKPKFLEVLHAIREEMSREADYDVELFAEIVRTGKRPSRGRRIIMRGAKTHAPSPDEKSEEKLSGNSYLEAKRKFK
jgi:hypothetical protein